MVSPVNSGEIDQIYEKLTFTKIEGQKSLVVRYNNRIIGEVAVHRTPFHRGGMLNVEVGEKTFKIKKTDLNEILMLVNLGDPKNPQVVRPEVGTDHLQDTRFQFFEGSNLTLRCNRNDENYCGLPHLNQNQGWAFCLENPYPHPNEPKFRLASFITDFSGDDRLNCRAVAIEFGDDKQVKIINPEELPAYNEKNEYLSNYSEFVNGHLVELKEALGIYKGFQKIKQNP